jgi:hypothetical protein
MSRHPRGDWSRKNDTKCHIRGGGGGLSAEKSVTYYLNGPYTPCMNATLYVTADLPNFAWIFKRYG